MLLISLKKGWRQRIQQTMGSKHPGTIIPYLSRNMPQQLAVGAVYRNGIKSPRAEPLPRKSRDTSSKSLARGCHSRKQIQDRRVRVVEEVFKNPLQLTTYRRHTLDL